MSKIKWNWKLRIKKNTRKIDNLEGFFKDIKDRVENIELWINTFDMALKNKEIIQKLEQKIKLLENKE